MLITTKKRVANAVLRQAPCSSAFTLIEVLVAIVLLVAAMAIAFSAYFGVTKAWQRGVLLADSLNHGDYLMEQLVNGLRCAYFPPSSTNSQQGRPTDYGFILEKAGGDTAARDTICWVKTGSALLSPEDALRHGLHRVLVSLEEDQEGTPAVAVRSWRPYANPDSFDPLQQAPFYVLNKVRSLGYRVATNRTEQGWEWQEDWADEATNHLPAAVEITLLLESLDERDQPVTIQRLVEIPLAPLSWSKKR
ncbi:MAG: prepilin-type N-terminal cleavage/methylation domain-containing protein [Lentisphaerae bacterium]|jgi:prepilin-type N-terminal cleavage/methylation domain-containing protein|nr:prepilin-type N-terminal cleavage/methylation domain-containing protein [Lentisphaerota bacterium]